MSDRVHRIVMFYTAISAGVAGITGLSDAAGVEVVSWIAMSSLFAGIIGNSWRILFPDSGSGT